MSFFQIVDIVGAIAIFLAIIAVLLLTVRWIFRDAESRGVSGLLAVLLVLASGIYIWVITMVRVSTQID